MCNLALIKYSKLTESSLQHATELLELNLKRIVLIATNCQDLEDTALTVRNQQTSVVTMHGYVVSM